MKTQGELHPLFILPLTIGFTIAFMLTSSFFSVLPQYKDFFPFFIFGLFFLVFTICVLYIKIRKNAIYYTNGEHLELHGLFNFTTHSIAIVILITLVWITMLLLLVYSNLLFLQLFQKH